MFYKVSPSIWAKLFLGETWSLSLTDPESGTCMQVRGGAFKFNVKSIRNIEITTGIIWSGVTLRTADKTYRLEGLSARIATSTRQNILAFLHNHIAHIVSSDQEQVKVIDSTIGQLVRAKERYLARSDIAEAVSKIGSSSAQALAHPLLTLDLLPGSIAKLLKDPLQLLLDPTVRDAYNESFIEHELDLFKEYFDNFAGTALTDEQRQACIRLEDSNILVAAAGSGKTAAMVAKVAYLLKKQRFRAEEILVLAYNKDAANELRERLAAELKIATSELGCRVSTFHSLGSQIIRAATRATPQLASWVEHPAGESRLISTMIEDLKQSDPEFKKDWRDLLIYFPKADLPLETFTSELDYQRYIEDRKDPEAPNKITNKASHQTVMTLIPDLYVRSLEEQKIANWLWTQSVDFEYEKSLKDNLTDGGFISIRPDFFYPKTETFHEHVALNSDGTSPFKDYVENLNAKRKTYKEQQLDYFETSSANAKEGKLFVKLEKELNRRSIETKQRSDEEVDQAVKQLTHVVRKYHGLFSVCIKHIRSGNLKLNMLQRRAESLTDQRRAHLFINVLWKLLESYNDKLDQQNKIDFESMIGDATTLVENAAYKSQYKLILVDEFQDISEPRARLLKALKNQMPFCKIFVVGDDWQSIYRFAGSDVTIFTGFEKHFGEAWQGKLQKTFRSNEVIAKLSADFIQKNPDQVDKAVSSSRPGIPKSVRVVPISTINGKTAFDKACLKILERINNFLKERGETRKYEVLVLSRYNFNQPSGLKNLVLSHLNVSYKTFHRSKGLEADFTVLLDVSEGIYGVPSRIEDDELLNLVVPLPETFPYAEERRLFYVALTRASKGAFLLHGEGRPSRFIAEIEGIAPQAIKFESVEGTALQTCPSCKTGFLIERQSKKTGLSFWGCSAYPGCNYIDRNRSCPNCTNGRLRRRKNKTSGQFFLACDAYPRCKYIHR